MQLVRSKLFNRTTTRHSLRNGKYSRDASQTGVKELVIFPHTKPSGAVMRESISGSMSGKLLSLSLEQGYATGWYMGTFAQ